MISMMIIAVLMVSLFFAVIKIGLRLAWGATKFLFGLGLFWVCPALFFLAVLFGGFSYMWIPIVAVGLLSGFGFRRI